MVGPEHKATATVDDGPGSRADTPPPPEAPRTAGADGPDSAGGDGLRYFGPSPRWRVLDVRELWRSRELLWMLALRDIKIRYRQAIVGVVWVVLQPLSTAFVFVMLFGLLGHTPTEGNAPYGLFVLTGVVLWQLFAGTVSQATGSLVANQHLLGKVFFPRLLLPLGAGIANLVDFAVGLVVVLCVCAAFGIAPTWRIAFLPAFVLFALTVGLAVGIWGAALNAMYRDTGLLIPFLLQIGFFFSPVVYSTGTLVPEGWRGIHFVNPMVGVVSGFRWSLLGGPAPTWSLTASVLATGVLLVTGLIYFRRVEGVLADRI